VIEIPIFPVFASTMKLSLKVTQWRMSLITGDLFGGTFGAFNFGEL